MKGKQVWKERLRPRCCNLCSQVFVPRTVFDRFCVTCKEGSELIKFSEWLPESEAAVQQPLSA